MVTLNGVMCCKGLQKWISIIGLMVWPGLGIGVMDAAEPGALASSKRPNVLFVFADDWGRVAGAYAKADGPGSFNDVVKTPHIDAIAESGVLFRRAYVSAPSCTPSRSALLSGQHFWRTGRASILRGAVWDGSSPSYLLMLKEAGYHVGKSYKVWGPGTPQINPWGGRECSYEKSGNRFNQFSQHVTRMLDEGRSLQDAKADILAEVSGNFESFLKARKDGQPFHYWFGPTNTHRKWIKGSGKRIWGIDPDSLKGKLPPFLPDVPEVREDFADYLGEVQALDEAVGLLIDKLKKIGEYDHTIIVLSGDHGPPGFPHGKCNLYDFGTSVTLAISGPGVKGGRVVDDLTCLTDLAPTFLASADVKIPDVMTGRNLWPLLSAEQSGVIDSSRDAVFAGRERHVENAREGFLPYPQRALRTSEHLLIINFKPDRWPLGEPYRLDTVNEPDLEELTEETRATLPDEDSSPTKAWLVKARHQQQWKGHFESAYGKRPRVELYDLKKDPHQVNNVAEDPAYRSIRQQLEERLLGELVKTGDPRMIEDGKFYETPPMSGSTADVEKNGGGKTPEELRRGPVNPRL